MSEQKETKACPYCGEEILAVAVKCKHCGEMLDQEEYPPPVVEIVLRETANVFGSAVSSFSKIAGVLLIIFGFLLSLSFIGALIGIPMIIAGVVCFFSPALAAIIFVVGYLFIGGVKNSFNNSSDSKTKGNENTYKKFKNSSKESIENFINNENVGHLIINSENKTIPTEIYSAISDNNLSDTRKINARCNLIIKGKQVMSGPCHFSGNKSGDNFDDLKLELRCPDGKITAGAGDGCAGFEMRTAQNGVFGQIFRDNGLGRLCWNEGEFRRAQECFENLERKGACWTNSEVSFCGYKD